MTALNSYYDFNDPTNPIKQYIHRVDVIEADANAYNSHYYYVRENEVIFANGTTQSFYDAYSGYSYE